MKNIEKFTLKNSLRKRDEWLADLHRAFEGDPRKFKKDFAKILLAQEYMDTDCRTRWKRHQETLEETPPVLRALARLEAPSQGVYQVPIQAKDSRVGSLSFVAPAVAVR